MFYMKRVLKGESRITHHINKGFLTFYLVFCVTVAADDYDVEVEYRK